ncbi:synaptojanin [Pancytospora epiphaga]|nr:synaptojanin [Pancytospora epiphaga]
MHQLFYNKDAKQVRYVTEDGTVEIGTSTGCLFSGKESTYKMFGILGILQLPDEGTYLLFASEAELVGEGDCGEIFRILEVQFLPFHGPETCQEVEGIKTLIEENCFYCCSGKVDEEFLWNSVLISTFNGCKTGKEGDSTAENSHLPEANRGTCFVDNKGMFSMENRTVSSMKKKKKIKLRDIIDSSTRLERQFGMDIFAQGTISQGQHYSSLASKTVVIRRTPGSNQNYLLMNMFCGYFESQTYLSDSEYRFIIQSRISSKKIGTRLLSRGVDDGGNVSFFVETSFQVESNGKKEVFNVTRGSVPLFWSQDDPLRPHRIQIDRDLAESYGAFSKHFENIRKRYGQIVVLDLLGHKKYERMLRKLYQEGCKTESIPYLHFDLNRNTDDFSRLKNILYTKMGELKEVATRGEITFRVNCLDCLDRTNLVQFLIFNFLYSYKCDVINQMWKHNGNALSNFYTGSDALKAELATKGKISVIGRMNDLIISANRMIKNKFSDQEKQRCIDVLLGRFYQ